ncbi:MAG TPA: choice-of-anchor J domain-containing protein [Phycisphaerae bacterium]|nr:choice-of-anchor J domain-containing protein [Phycisphaerae bacterium]
MTTKFNGCVVYALATVALVLMGVSPALAQANFSENMDTLGDTSFGQPGPPELVSGGWIFRNQSNPIGSQTFYAGPCYYCGTAHSGTRTLSSDFNSIETGSAGTVSNWALFPAIPNQIAGDTVTVYARALMTGNVPAQLQIRYSPTGGTNTGSGVTDVGNFTQLLLDVNPVSSTGWTQYSATAPGNGRLALRFYAPNIEPVFIAGNTWLELDTLSVGPPQTPSCNLPPVPQSGQTITWSTSNSPYRACQSLSIPAGGTVNVQPGVQINFDSGRQLIVAGTLNINASAAAPAVFTAPNSFPPFLVVSGGTLEAHFTEFHQQLRIGSAANVLLSDCTFAFDGLLSSDDIPNSLPYVRLERCTFTDSYMSLSGCLAVLRDNTFTNTYAQLLRTFADVTAPNTFNGQPLRINRQESIQPLAIDGISGAGSTMAGLALDGGMYRLGPNVVLQGNAYPLELHGGLTPDSVVPMTGNTNNAINVGDGGFAGTGQWSDLGLPYRLTEPSTEFPGGHLTISPGVVVEASDPNAGLLFRSTRQGVLDGLPGAPITFRGLNGQLWSGLTFYTNSTTGCRMEYCVVEDAHFGVTSTDNALYVDNCMFTGNVIGANMNTSGSIRFRKARFVTNYVGLDFTDQGSPTLNSPNNPNSFEGNNFGIDAFEFGSSADARNCWWNHPSGPQVPGNPGGQGDSISGDGATGVQYQPFLTAPPDFTNTPPVVRMIEPGMTQRYASPDYIHPDYLLDQGTKYIVCWDVQSDDAIANQRIEFSPDGHYQDRFTVLVDGIPGDARSWELTIPNPGYAVTNQPQFLRVVAVDAAGQEAWDQAAVLVPSGDVVGSLTITTDLSGQTFFGGFAIPPDVQWTGSVNFGLVTPLIVLESDGAAIKGLSSGNGQGFFFQDFPFVSTDRARLALQVTNNSNAVAWFFADGYFSIRHDPRLGFEPPIVTMQTPQAGGSFPGGGTVPITWSASAPEGIRSFDIQASYDQGRTWHPIVLDLPAAARDYAWQLPASGGIADVRLRVIARDQRFQNSSDETEGSFSIVPAAIFGDINGDGFVNLVDADVFVAVILGSDPDPMHRARSDLNGDGMANGADTQIFVDHLLAQ